MQVKAEKKETNDSTAINLISFLGAMEEAIAGFAAGVVGTLIGYPLDSIKTRMQAGAKGPGLIKHIISSEGIGGFYRGVASPLLALTVLNTLNFSSYARFRSLYNVDDGLISAGGFELKVAAAAATVGPLASMISTPFELVKTQMVINQKNSSTSGSSSSRPSSIRTAYSIVRQYGIQKLYIAHGVNTTREIVFLSTYFTVYEHSKSYISDIMYHKWGWSSNASIPVAGGISGAIGWFVSFPLDCIKSNIQGIPFPVVAASSNNTPVITRPSAFTVAKSLIASKGIAGLYSGVGPSIARAFLVSASRFSIYEGVLSVLRKTKEEM